ncbi:LytTR family transcriptional regulator [bacterium]|nr:LytTR family transcriptional regulator [bacterium]
MKPYLEKIALKEEFGKVTMIEVDAIFYLEAQGGDSLIQTARQKPYFSKETLGELEERLDQPFFRCHRSFIVNLNRVQGIEKEGQDWHIRMDPPVNKVIPIARRRYSALKKVFKI